jgi:predicted dehydrogenase
LQILIIGCGNIGALYDYENDSILTHAKAFSKKARFKIYFYDSNILLAKKIADKYKSVFLTDLNKIDFSEYDCISICTPTATHFQFLKRAIESNVKLIICEKPVSNSEVELLELKKLYENNKSKIIVNYIRRFQPSFSWLKKFIEELMISEKLTNVGIRYQRGFINNCSHAFDLIAFLTSWPIDLRNLHKQNFVYDHFHNDPTLSLLANWNDVNVNVLGLSNVQFSHFEIDLYFSSVKIAIKESGDQIDIFESENFDNFLKPLKFNKKLSRKNCLKNYMLEVVDSAIDLIDSESNADNFIESVNLNLLMLKYLNNKNG